MDRLQRQLEFAAVLDRLKEVQRQTLLISGARRENSAEHSWHLAMLAFVLREYAPEGTDHPRCTAMLLIHDIVEIEAGDTDVNAPPEVLATQAAREAAAAAKLFAMLPVDQEAEIRALWDEFGLGQSPSARFAQALDRLQPLLLVHRAGGKYWLDRRRREADVRARNAPIFTLAPLLGPLVESLIASAVAQGWLIPG